MPWTRAGIQSIFSVTDVLLPSQIICHIWRRYVCIFSSNKNIWIKKNLQINYHCIICGNLYKIIYTWILCKIWWNYGKMMKYANIKLVSIMSMLIYIINWRGILCNFLLIELLFNSKEKILFKENNANIKLVSKLPLKKSEELFWQQQKHLIRMDTLSLMSLSCYTWMHLLFIYIVSLIIRINIPIVNTVTKILYYKSVGDAKSQ